MKLKKSPIDVFDNWVKIGKDDGLEKNHSSAVAKMVEYSTGTLKQFSFIDAGCGNGWLVRNMSNDSRCIKSIGVDGSKKMINKAKKLDKKNEYVCSDLLNWKPNQKVNLVISMEVFYYFENPEKLTRHIYQNWLTENSRLTIGIDFYKENIISHSWPKDIGVSIMKLFSENEWKQMFLSSNYKNVHSWRIDQKKGWEGTLIVTGEKL